MARSDYIGEPCISCKKVWKSEDFERVEVIDRDYFNEDEGVMFVGQFWKIRCKLCGETGLYLYSSNPK